MIKNQIKPVSKKGIGEALRALRGPLLQRELAEMAGLTVHQVYKIEQGKCFPPFNVACALADALGVSLDELRG